QPELGDVAVRVGRRAGACWLACRSGRSLWHSLPPRTQFHDREIPHRGGKRECCVSRLARPLLRGTAFGRRARRLTAPRCDDIARPAPALSTEPQANRIYNPKHTPREFGRQGLTRAHAASHCSAEPSLLSRI